MPQTRKNRKNRSKRGGDIDPKYAIYDNNKGIIGYKNHPRERVTTPENYPAYSLAAQPDVISDISSPSSRSSSSYILSPTSTLSSVDRHEQSVADWHVMPIAGPRRSLRTGRRLDFDNVGSGLLKKSRKSRKGRKMRKSRKGRGKTRKNRRRSRRHRRHRR